MISTRKAPEISLRSLKRAKATEQQILLFHVLLPILKDYLDIDLFAHLGLFVTAIQTLNQDICSVDEITEAHDMLDEYHRLTEDLYGRQSCTYTNHAR